MFDRPRKTVAQIMSGVDVAPGTKPKSMAINTVRYTDANGDTRYRFHETDIVIAHKDGTFTLNTGGWNTPTTKERISRYAPVRPYTVKGQLWLNSETPFFDGVHVDAEGKPMGVEPFRKSDAKDNLKLRARINKFVRMVDDCKTLPIPDNGDCWFCSMFDKGGKDTSHLQSHVDDSYLHGSLLVNAMREAGFGDDQIRLHYRLNVRFRFKASLRKYMMRHLADVQSPKTQSPKSHAA
jgi:hypothetical protein